VTSFDARQVAREAAEAFRQKAMLGQLLWRGGGSECWADDQGLTIVGAGQRVRYEVVGVDLRQALT